MKVAYLMGWLFAYGLYRDSAACPDGQARAVDVAASIFAATFWPLFLPYTAGCVLGRFVRAR